MVENNIPDQARMKVVKSRKVDQKRLKSAVEGWLLQLPHELTATDTDSIDSLLRKLPSSYCIYEPMLLLPFTFFADPEWLKLMDAANDRMKQDLFLRMTSATNTTHIAVNAPIPNSSLEYEQPENNVMRRPRNLTALFGNFGPSPVDCADPTCAEMNEAFWVSTKQNGIYQTWAPMYTMFSRGNITEKARLLQLPSVSKVHSHGSRSGTGWSAVDLFAGIGYFAFSYARAGATIVLCWEINPWSIEGFRKGARANRWQTHEVMPDEIIEKASAEQEMEDKKFLIFCESNSHAEKRIETIREVIAPVRHVNCGLLPSSARSWQTALLCLDCTLGGWLHVHENLDARATESEAALIVAEINNISDNISIATRGKRCYRVALEHVQKVKSYAPNVIHCVLDIIVSPEGSYNIS